MNSYWLKQLEEDKKPSLFLRLVGTAAGGIAGLVAAVVLWLIGADQAQRFADDEASAWWAFFVSLLFLPVLAVILGAVGGWLGWKSYGPPADPQDSVAVIAPPVPDSGHQYHCLKCGNDWDAPFTRQAIRCPRCNAIEGTLG